MAPTFGRDSEIAPTEEVWDNKVLLYFVAQPVRLCFQCAN